MPLSFLIIRFSAIGDVVLTTPVIRSLKRQFPDAEIHYVTKASNKAVLLHNPHISHIHVLEDDLGKTISALKQHSFDHIFDLHNNLRSWRVKRALGVASTSFRKKNLDKWLLCQPLLRRFARPIEHVVQRYGDTLKSVEATLDHGGLDVFLTSELNGWAAGELAQTLPKTPRIAVVLGATYATKRWITDYFPKTLNQYRGSVVLIGGPDTTEEAKAIADELEIPFYNAVGKYGLLKSAALMKGCDIVLSHDTGFMHIAAAFGQNVISIWGNTVPEFGMTPYNTEHSIIEVKDLSCRPCSKIGHSSCPKGHFDCMRSIMPEEVLKKIQ